MRLGAAQPLPEQEEARSVGFLLALSEAMKALAGSQLLYARLNWDTLFVSADPPGALPPSVARETMTRKAQRRWRAERSERRGAAALIRAAFGT